MINRPQIKSEAKHIIRTARVSPLAMSAIMLLIAFILERVSDLVEYGSLFASYAGSAAYMDALISGDLTVLAETGSSSGFFSPMTLFFTILINLFTVVLDGGYYSYCIGIRRGVQMPYSSLLDGLSVSGRLIWCGILMTIKTFLWSMLFVIPGLVALYRYRFAYYNILTDPNLSASDAIRLSCQQTRGMKMSLFALDLSFFGWLFLPDLVSGLLNWMRLFPAAAAVQVLISIWTMPYMTLCDLAYYDETRRRMAEPPVWNMY